MNNFEAKIVLQLTHKKQRDFNTRKVLFLCYRQAKQAKRSNY